MKAANQSTATLEQRLRAVEDRLEIYNLIAGHPPSADTGADYFVRAVYEPDGVLDLGGDKKARGNEAVAAIVRTPAHQAAIDGGLAHFAGLPRIEIDGDTAVVTSYLQILTPDAAAEPVEVPGHGASKGARGLRAQTMTPTAAIVADGRKCCRARCAVIVEYTPMPGAYR